MKQAKNRGSPKLKRHTDAVEPLLQFMRRSMRDSAANSSIDLTALIDESRAGYKLDELLAQCNPTAPPPGDMAAWENLSDVGREKLVGNSSRC